MQRRWARYVLDVALLLAAVVVLLTGLLVDQLDLHQFTPHRWAGYVVAVLIAVHVGLHWRWLVPFGSGDGRRSLASGGAPPHALPAAVSGQSSGRPSDQSADQPADRGPPSRRVALTALGAGAAGAAAGWFAKAEVSPTPYPGGDVGLFYHRESSLGLLGLLG
ncbi:MAG: DUF4405 domain-containing protein, partial [Actinomycetes bacterium]